MNLTPAEQKIVQLLKQGRSNKEIAMQLGVAESTVKNHLGNIYKKTGEFNRSTIAVKATMEQASNYGKELLKFTQHKGTCNFTIRGGNCDCGLDKAIKRLRSVW